MDNNTSCRLGSFFLKLENTLVFSILQSKVKIRIMNHIGIPIVNALQVT